MTGISQVCPDYRLKPMENHFLHTVKREGFLIPGSDMDNFIFTIPEMFAI